MLRCLFLLHFCYLISPFSSDGEIHLDTPYSRLLGKPPIMVAGMTPSSRLVSSVLSLTLVTILNWLVVATTKLLPSAPRWWRYRSRSLPVSVSQRGSSENHSNYAVCAVNPSRVLTTFSDAALREVVNNVATRTTSLLIIMLMYVLTFQPHPFWFLMHLQGLRDMSAPENSSLCRL